MTILSVAQGVAAVVGLEVPTSLYGDMDRTAVELQFLAADVAESICDSHDWSQLTRALSVTGPEMALPTDFRRFRVDAQLTDGTHYLARLPGPSTSAGWYLIDGRIYLSGAGTATGEYQSSRYALSEGGAAKATFDVDSDSFALSERLLRLGMIWQWKANKGLPYGQDFDNFQKAKETEIGTQGRRAAFAVGRVRMPRDLVSTNINVDVAAPAYPAGPISPSEAGTGYLETYEAAKQ